MTHTVKDALKSLVPPTVHMLDRRVDRLSSEIRGLQEAICELSSIVESNQEELEWIRASLSRARAEGLREKLKALSQAPLFGNPDVVVSITSYGPRVHKMVPMLESLREQTVRPDRAFVWLPLRDFPNGVSDLPAEVVCALNDSQVEPRFTDDDLGPHGKYFWAMQAFPESNLITLDDDIVYPSWLIEELISGHRRWPDEVVALRTHLISFGDEGILPYRQWGFDQTEIIESPSHRLLATGVGGVLYPPHCLTSQTFDDGAIRATCLHADDLWLKVMEVVSDTRVVALSRAYTLDYAEGTQEVARCNENLYQGENDIQLAAILEYFEDSNLAKTILRKMAGKAAGE